MIRLSKSSIGDAEKKAVNDVLDRAFLGMGAEVASFEDELSSFIGRPVVCVTNGTAAIQLALQAAGITEGDEVLVQSLTYLASFQAISATGASPIACDVNAHSLTIDCNDARMRITERTKAIMPVHYAGGVGDLDEVYRLAQEFDLRVIEDAAHAFGSIYKEKKVGGFGDIACFSFDGIKNITSGEGGCVVSNDLELLARVRDARLLGVIGDSDRRKQGERTWEPEVQSQGWRYHMSDIMAALGRVQLKRLSFFAKHRQGLIKHYLDNLNANSYLAMLDYDLENTVPHIFVVRVLAPIERDKLRTQLLSQNIQSGIHYYPNHRLEYYKSDDHDSLPQTEIVAEQLLSLPLHFELTNEDVDKVCKCLNDSIIEQGIF